MKKTLERVDEQSGIATQTKSSRGSSRMHHWQSGINQSLQPLGQAIVYPFQAASFLGLVVIFMVPLGVFQLVFSVTSQDYREF